MWNRPNYYVVLRHANNANSNNNNNNNNNNNTMSLQSEPSPIEFRVNSNEIVWQTTFDVVLDRNYQYYSNNNNNIDNNDNNDNNEYFYFDIEILQKKKFSLFDDV